MDIDIVAIHTVLAGYGRLIDTRNAYDWARLFAADGRLEIVGHEPHIGHEALRAFAENSPVGTHLTGIPEIERLRSGEVSCVSTWLFRNRVDGGIKTGFYRDVLVRDPATDELLFAHRLIEMAG